MIEIENVSKHFVSRDRDRVAALSNVSISIRRNEFVCLVGPSGCGKSTLLRLVGGLLPVSQGRVMIEGKLGRRAARGDRHRVSVAHATALGERARQRALSRSR